MRESFPRWENAKMICRKLSHDGKTPSRFAGNFLRVRKYQDDLQETFPR
ncbi:hypothetical protein [Bergeyella porcorum]